MNKLYAFTIASITLLGSQVIYSAQAPTTSAATIAVSAAAISAKKAMNVQWQHFEGNGKVEADEIAYTTDNGTVQFVYPIYEGDKSCPISNEVSKEPVILPKGLYYLKKQSKQQLTGIGGTKNTPVFLLQSGLHQPITMGALAMPFAYDCFWSDYTTLVKDTQSIHGVSKLPYKKFAPTANLQEDPDVFVKMWRDDLNKKLLAEAAASLKTQPKAASPKVSSTATDKSSNSNNAVSGAENAASQSKK